MVQVDCGILDVSGDFSEDREERNGEAGCLLRSPLPQEARNLLPPLSRLWKSRGNADGSYPAVTLTYRTFLTSTAVNVKRKKKVGEDKVFRNSCNRDRLEEIRFPGGGECSILGIFPVEVESAS